MITTVTLNTAVDKRYVMEDFEKGRVYRTNTFQATAGGKGINVTRVIKDLKEEVTAIGFVGGTNGQFIKDELCKLNINNDFVQIKGETRNCIAILAKDGSQTEILEPGPVIFQEEVNSFIARFHKACEESSVITISGSLPLGVKAELYSELLKIASDKKARVILDCSGEPLKKAINSKPFLVKPNEDELEAIINKSIDNEADIIAAGRYLLRKGIEYAVVSLGKKGALVFHRDKGYRVILPKVKAVNPVGSGDAMVAGFAVAIDRGCEVPEMIAFAAACGTANALEIETGKVNLDNVNSLMKVIKVEQFEL